MKLTPTHDAQLIGGYRDKRRRSFAVGQRVKVFAGIVRKLSAKLDQVDATTYTARFGPSG